MACTSRSISSRRAVADRRLAVVVDLEHQLLGLLLVVSEVGAEDVGHVAHQVDRVVPHDGDPRLRRERDLVRREVRLDLDRTRGRHAAMVAQQDGRSWPYADPVRASTALLTDHYELTMLQAALASGMAQRRSVFELYPRRLPEGRRYGVVAGVGRALEAIEDFRFDDEVLRTLEDVVDERTPRVAGDPPVLRRRLGVRRGRPLLPLLPARDRRGHLRRGRPPRDGAALDLQPRQRDRVGGLPDDPGGGRSALHRDGVAAYPRGGRGRVRACGVHRRLRDQLQPRGSAAVRRPHGRDQRAQLHPPARLRGRCLPGPGGVARAGHDPARRHLRRPRGGPARDRRRRHRARRGPHRLRATRGRWRTRCGPSSTRSARPTPGSWSPATSTSSRSPPWRRRRWTAYGVGTQLVIGSGHPTCGFVYKLVARERRRRRDGRRREEEQGQDLDRRSQVGDAPAVGGRCRRGGGDRDRQAAR